MGEAKRRGTREVRVAQAIDARNARLAEQRRQAEEAEAKRQQRVAEQWNRLPTEEKKQRLERAKRYATALGGLMASPVGRLLAESGVVLSRPYADLPSDTRTAGDGEVERG